MSVKVRIWILLCSFVVGMLLLYASNVYIEEEVYNNITRPQIISILKSKYEYALKSAVDIQAENLAMSVKGITDKKAIYDIIERETEHQRFFPEDEGYYFTYTTEGVRINVPTNKSLNGKNLITLTDPDGFLFVREFVNQAQAGGGFVNYQFEKVGQGLLPKLSYVRLVPGTDVLIGTGVYIDGIELEKNRIQKLIKDQNAEYLTYQIVIVVALLVFILGLGAACIRSINRPLQMLTGVSVRIAEGDLEAKAHMEKGIPKEIVTMNTAIQAMVNVLKVKMQESISKGAEAEEGMKAARLALEDAEKAKAQAETARHDGMFSAATRMEGAVEIITSAASQLSAQIAQSERGAVEQASRVTETATAMEEMNSTVLEVAKNASIASEVSTSTRQKAEAGAEVVQRAVATIRQVQEQSIRLKQDMTLLDDNAKAINQIMNVISDIADQTNLLALNAAIEAARAGEAGRGFAVVADEVRKLAEKTMNSTTDVGNAIRAIQKSATQSMEQVDASVKTIEEATDYANQSGLALQEIVTMVDSTADQVRGIATASEQQSASSEEINQSINQVNTIATETARSMQEAANAVSELANQAHVLNGLIETMKHD